MTKNTASVSKEDEPSIAPLPDRWYNISLGPSFGHHHPSSKFCTLRYEFKPASVDKNQPGLLRKKKVNRVSVEFQNNQHGKPKVVFDGVAEDYKDNDAVLFFDGETFRLERLHRAVKRLRHMRVPGECAAAVAVGPAVESSSPPHGKAANLQNFNKGEAQDVSVEVEKIDMGNLEAIGLEPEDENTADRLPPSSSTPDVDIIHSELEEHLDVVDSKDGHEAMKAGNLSRRQIHSGIDINIPHQGEDDDEIANVDVSDDESNLGYNAAEALRAQVAGERQEHSSTSSSSSESEGSESSSDSSSDSGSRSGSGSSGSGSDSESSDGDSVTSI